MTSPPVLSSGGHPHPPPSPPPAVPPLVNNQPSLLGDPPFHLLVPQNNPNVLRNELPYLVYFSNQFDSVVPLVPLVPLLVNNQPSLLGDPPFHLLVPQNNPNVLPNPVYFSNQFDIGVPPPPPLPQPSPVCGKYMCCSLIQM